MQSNNSKKTHRIGVVGIGFGQQVTVPAFRADGRCEVTAIAATSNERATKVALTESIKHAFGNWQDLVRCSEVDIVAIAVPPKIQSQIITAAAEAGKAVFAEKPLTGSLEDARLVAEVVQRYHTPLAVNFVFPQIPAWKKAKARLVSGEIGELTKVEVNWQFETYGQKHKIENWKTRVGGGALHSFGSHIFYYLEWLGGRLNNIAAKLHADPGASDHAFDFTATFEAGAEVSVSVSARSPQGLGHQVELTGTRGKIILNNEERAATPEVRLQPTLCNIAGFLNFLEGKSGQFPTFTDGLRVEELMHAARVSDQNHDRHPHSSLQRGRKHTLGA